MKTAQAKTASAQPRAAFTDQVRASRVRLIRLIHVARRELSLEDDTYRAMLLAAGGADSTSKMEIRALQVVLDHLKAKGFKVRASSKPKPDRRQDSSVSASKVRALWLFLAELGVVRDPSERALAVYCKRIAKVDDLHWANGDAMHDLIETLKKWAMRFLPAAINTLMEEVNQAHRRQPFSQEQAAGLQGAVSRAREGGFDANWFAWEKLTEALNSSRQDLQTDGEQP